jgi:energy-coupling factor transporter transmembrane protein EcfT
MVGSRSNGSDSLLARLHRRTACIAVVAMILISLKYHNPKAIYIMVVQIVYGFFNLKANEKILNN